MSKVISTLWNCHSDLPIVYHQTAAKGALMVNQISRIRLYALIMAVSWTVSLGCSLAWLCYQEREYVLNIALAEARATFERILSIGAGPRYMGACTSQLLPNPNLSHVPERDIVTPQA